MEKKKELISFCNTPKFQYICTTKVRHNIIHNKMRKVIGIGETVLDIIFKDNKPVHIRSW